eukprot:TRINITY_DN2406_c0_g1_i12.p3 TRINITY_DN2406_c0_g1~~TRINITY_DN2406_c0_g1_i12.p3  ORF type:complete len:110 (+),score=1.25 TRINITY_DN2406_c0_g1_i12:674-1003(+)
MVQSKLRKIHKIYFAQNSNIEQYFLALCGWAVSNQIRRQCLQPLFLSLSDNVHLTKKNKVFLHHTQIIKQCANFLDFFFVGIDRINHNSAWCKYRLLLKYGFKIFRNPT